MFTISNHSDKIMYITLSNIHGNKSQNKLKNTQNQLIIWERSCCYRVVYTTLPYSTSEYLTPTREKLIFLFWTTEQCSRPPDKNWLADLLKSLPFSHLTLIFLNFLALPVCESQLWITVLKLNTLRITHMLQDGI